jgi:mono/diheme cytochrome c family protein
MRRARGLCLGRSRTKQVLRIALLGAWVVVLSACIPQQMERQAKYKPFDTSKLFADGAAMRQLEPGTVPRGQRRTFAMDLAATAPAAAGLAAAPIAYEIPPPKVDRALLATGRERYRAFCAPCHGNLGAGDGVIVQHGYPTPPSYHIDRLRKAPDGHFYNVITRGYGVMYPYAARVTPAERWAIIAYIRALQLSQHAVLTDVPPEARAALAGGPP